MLKAFCAVLFFFSLQVVAAPGKKRTAEKAPRPSFFDQLEHRLNLDWLNGGYIRGVSESIYNPNNTTFDVDHMGARTDLNVDYRMIWNGKHKFVLRPRAYSQYYEIIYKDEDPSRAIQLNRGKVDLTEAFIEAWLTDSVSLTVGLQNYQWGPAEILSPSQPLFHFNREQRSLLWKEKGRNIVRLNITPTDSLSVVLISEPVNNAEKSFIAEREFSSKHLVKAEYRSLKEAQNYVGAVGGTEEESNVFAGGYFNYMPLEGFSVYADGRWTRDGFAYYPEQENPFFYDMIPDPRYVENTWHHLGVYGLRYESGDWDLRGEYIYNSRGYNKDDFENALISAVPQNPNSQSNADRLRRPGLELLGEHYGYISLRIPDIGDEDLWQVSVRYMHSGMDHTGVFSSSIERAVGDNFIALSEGRYAVGPQDGEFTLQEKYYVFLGLKTVW